MKVGIVSRAPMKHPGRFIAVWAGLAFGGGMVTVAKGSPDAGAQPMLSILYTNDTRGYLQTCGCNRTGLGGLDRRSTLTQQTRAEGRPLLVLDSGNLSDEPERARVILKAMAAMGYAAVGIGPLDLKIAGTFYQEAAEAGITVCVSPPRPEGVPEAVPPVRQVEVGGVRVGIVALAPTGFEQSDDAVWGALEPTLRELRVESDLVVVLSQGGLAQDRALAQRQAKEGLIDLLIGNAEARSLTKPEIIGWTWLLPTTDRGQEVGRVDVTSTDSDPKAEGNGRRAVPLLWRRIPLDGTFGPEPTVEKIVGEYFKAQAQRLLDASARNVPKRFGPGLDPESVVGRDYLPAEKCAGCHQPQWERWLTQKHAHAVETLAAKQRLVADCLPCHSEQYRRTGKFVPGLDKADGVQCSTCHGEGVVHSLLERKDRIIRDPGEELCVTCHDGEKDPIFEYAAAFRKVQH